MFLFWIFWRKKMRCFWVKKLMEIWHLLIAENLLLWSFWEWEIRPFLSQNVDGKMLFTDYWKVLVSNFSMIENTVFFWIKKLMERWYLLINENFLFWTWRWWEIRSFFQPKRWWKDYIYLVFLSFPWYSGTWERWFFVQCRQASSK